MFSKVVNFLATFQSGRSTPDFGHSPTLSDKSFKSNQEVKEQTTLFRIFQPFLTVNSRARFTVEFQTLHSS